MRYFWLLLLLATPVAMTALLIAAPSMGWWFPERSPSPLGRDIEGLFNTIGWIVMAIFGLTQVGLIYSLWKGTAKPDEEKGLYSHGNHKLEVAWTVIPAIILVFIAVIQNDVWAEMKYQNGYPEGIRTVAEVQARQFEWRIRYPGLDPKTGRPLPLENQPQPTDVWTVNDLHVPAGQKVLIRLKSQDVQHSFYLPELRTKQDAVPGLSIPVLIDADEPGNYVLMCAELCGWGHYKMNAQMVVEDQAAWDDWMAKLQAEQRDDGVKN